MKRAEFIRAYVISTEQPARAYCKKTVKGVKWDEVSFRKAQQIAANRFWRVHYRTLRLYTVSEVFPPLKGFEQRMEALWDKAG